MVKRILVAFRFSKSGLEALRMAAYLASVHGAWLHIFHALDYRLAHPQTPDERILQMTREIEERFTRECRPLLQGVSRFGFNCWEADPAVEVVKLAEETRADLVVVGCHQVGDRPGITRLGMVGLTIAQTAPCPVLLVPCPREAKETLSP
ncbi:universal stress protein [Desulfosoma caldarium]|uniref:Nucleotide-binding universal stress UspA family protein n=1 Tax=Desulfosoma caldarium TaxID=610254 RepID=A0A3N1UM74_9BACT|nr:universal stress protein [Desulfosoma caldarium]ROQ89820.1 nucleotide-binding universal stress UspA family protein [Desulfosoma caldarium]